MDGSPLGAFDCGNCIEVYRTHCSILCTIGTLKITTKLHLSWPFDPSIFNYAVISLPQSACIIGKSLTIIDLSAFDWSLIIGTCFTGTHSNWSHFKFFHSFDVIRTADKVGLHTINRIYDAAYLGFHWLRICVHLFLQLYYALDLCHFWSDFIRGLSHHWYSNDIEWQTSLLNFNRWTRAGSDHSVHGYYHALHLYPRMRKTFSLRTSFIILRSLRELILKQTTRSLKVF